MSDDDNTERWMQVSEALSVEFENLAAMLEGQVRHLTGNGWTDEQAREIVCKMVTGK